MHPTEDQQIPTFNIQKRMKRLILIALAAAMTLQGQAQGTREDYLNAFGTREKCSGKMLNGDVWVRPVHLAGADTMYYSTYNGTGTVWYSVNIHNGEKQQVENPDRNRQERRRGGGSQYHWMTVRDEKDGRAQNPADESQCIIHRKDEIAEPGNP